MNGAPCESMNPQLPLCEGRGPWRTSVLPSTVSAFKWWKPNVLWCFQWAPLRDSYSCMSTQPFVHLATFNCRYAVATEYNAHGIKVPTVYCSWKDFTRWGHRCDYTTVSNIYLRILYILQLSTLSSCVTYTICVCAFRHSQHVWRSTPGTLINVCRKTQVLIYCSVTRHALTRTASFHQCGMTVGSMCDFLIKQE